MIPTPAFDISAAKKVSVFNRLTGTAVLAPIAGIAFFSVLWWIAGYTITSNPELAIFDGFAPWAAITACADLMKSGDAWHASLPSLYRIMLGLAIALFVGAPLGLMMGVSSFFEKSVQFPFQLLRMISPLAWMPLAVLAFPTWNGAIVFLIAAAAIWPVVFATAGGVKRIDPAWLVAARTHGGSGFALMYRVIIPAVAPDLLTGLRLALGTAWIVLVPAEYLGVTSGLGYAINDARDTLSYDRLAGIVLLIGLIGYSLDFILARAIKKTSWVPSA